MSVINTNYLALVSQNNLTKSQNALGTAIERLSSGLRINSAKDDAAGQAIANRFTANIKGLTQATRNANDGISIAQTTEGALNEINNNLQRVRELTVQAANGTNSESDLQSIQDEITQRMGEIDRVSKQTQFNGVKVLSDKAGALAIQVGANDHETISIGLREISSKTLNLDDLDVTKAYDPSIQTVANGSSAMKTVTLPGDIATAVSAGGTYAQMGKADDGKYYVQVTGATDSDHDGYYELSVAANGTVDIANTMGTPDSVTAPAGFSQTEGISVKIDTESLAAPGANTDAEGGDINIVKSTVDGKYYAQVSNAKNEIGNGYYEVSIDWQTGDIALATGGTWNKAGQSNPANAPTGSNANPLDALDRALADVDSLRSELGAVQNRFQSTIANLSNTVSNLSAARSRIEDADYAVEVSNMTRAQILQQAGTSVLAQANQVPQGVLSLLR